MEKLSKRLLDKDVEFDLKRIPVAQPQLDPKNPRNQYLVQQKGGNANDAILHEALWEEDDTKQLKESIVSNGGVMEPIYVVPKVLEDGSLVYVPKEGNRRALTFSSTT